MRIISNIFGKSPFGPLQAHMREVFDCVSEIPSLFSALEENDRAKVELVIAAIEQKEGEADRIKNEIRDHLPRSIFLPVDRSDLLEILDIQDSIADSAQDVADIIEVRLLEVTPEIKPVLDELVIEVVEACRTAVQIADEFDRLLEASFGGPESEKVLQLVAAVGVRERAADECVARLQRVIVSEEGSLSPVSIFLWFRISELVGDIADYSEKMANRLRLLVAK